MVDCVTIGMSGSVAFGRRSTEDLQDLVTTISADVFKQNLETFV